LTQAWNKITCGWKNGFLNSLASYKALVAKQKAQIAHLQAQVDKLTDTLVGEVGVIVNNE
jgi:hypothetical protein